MKRFSMIMALMIVLVVIAPISLFADDVPSDFTLGVLVSSYAPWGTNSTLLIDSTGAVYFYEIESNDGAIDSIFATLDSSEIQSIYDTIVVVDFFGLDSLFDGDYDDGDGVRISILANDSAHTVEAVNYAAPEINRIIKTLNTFLEAEGIELIYSALVDTTIGRDGE